MAIINETQYGWKTGRNGHISHEKKNKMFIY